jgi:hypothetical protein
MLDVAPTYQDHPGEKSRGSLNTHDHRAACRVVAMDRLRSDEGRLAHYSYELFFRNSKYSPSHIPDQVPAPVRAHNSKAWLHYRNQAL